MLYSIELRDFFSPGKTLDKAHTIIHIAEPNAPHERERGYLFVLIQLTNGQVGLIEQCQKMIEYIEERYYRRDENPEYVLERILQAVNRDYKSHFLPYQTEMDCVIGIIKDNSLQVSYHGTPTAVVFFRQADQLSAISIVEEPNYSAELFFSELITGTLNPTDFFYAATPHTADYFPLDRIAKLLCDRPMREVGAHIQKVLIEIGSDYSFGGIVANTPHHKNFPPGGGTKSADIGSAASLNHLANATAETTNTLSPPIFGDIKKSIQKIKKTAPVPIYRNGRRPADPTHDHLLVGIGRGLILSMEGIARLIIKTGVAIGNLFSLLLKIIKNHSSRTEEINKLRIKFYHLKKTIVGLSVVSKALGLGLLVVVLLFLLSLGYLKINARQIAAESALNNIVQAIVDKKDAAEASIVYEDKAKAQILLNEARTLLTKLPTKSKTEQAKQAEMAALILTVQDKLRNEKRVTPELIADIGIVNPENKAEKLTWFNNTLIAFGANDESWYFINTATKSVEGKLHQALAKLTEATPSNEGDLIIFHSATGELGAFDTKTQALTKKNISYPTNNPTISTLEMYNRKLYTIDTANKKIYRHNQTQGGYDQGEIWSKTGEGRLAGAISMAIDGDLYLLKESGEVRKWFRGEEQSFNLAVIDPALNAGQKIAVPDGGDEIFILDSGLRRIAIFDKTGAFREQIISTTFKKPTGMVVTNNGKTIFILDSGSVYRINR